MIPRFGTLLLRMNGRKTTNKVANTKILVNFSAAAAAAAAAARGGIPNAFARSAHRAVSV